MKKFFNIFIIAFVLFSVYVVKDDLFTAYQMLKADIFSSNQIIREEGIDNLKEEINTKSETPGALRVINSVFSTTFDKSNLTQAGVIEWTNKNRMDIGGLAPLLENKKLNLSAQKKVNDMFTNQYFEHISPDGTGVGDLGKESGYEYVLIGENLALGNFKNDEAVLEAWMASPGHRANILNNQYTEIGVAVGHGVFEGNTVWLAVQHFGLPKSSCPSIDANLKYSIDSKQKILNISQSNLLKLEKEIKAGNATNEKIKEYNKQVGEYNSLLAEVKKEIDIYNTQVKAFNLCVEKATS